MPYRNKTYICFDADIDMDYYNLMKAWKAKDNNSFNFHNAHDLYLMQKSKLEDNNETYIKGKLKERFKNTKCFIVLVGEKTKNLYKYVRWEIETAINMDLPIIVVNLNGKNGIDRTLCPAILREELAIHVTYGKEEVAHAMENWPVYHAEYRRKKEGGPYRYKKFDKNKKTT
jgi:hypothetical protein